MAFAIRDLPTPPSLDRPTTFDPEMQALLQALPDFVADANALGVYLGQAAGAGLTIAYKFTAASTADSDPGAGYLKLNTGTQNAATFAYADLVDALGTTVTAQLDAMDDSSSSTKGFLRISAVGDGSKWLLFKVSGAVVTASGYRKLPLTVVAGSASSPFATDDPILVSFTQVGDKGDVGPTAQWAGILSGVTITGTPSSVTFSSIPNGYADLSFRGAVNLSTTSTVRVTVSVDGSTFSSDLAAGAVDASSFLVDLRISDYLSGEPTIYFGAGSGVGYTSPLVLALADKQYAVRLSGAITAVRFSTLAGTFTGGFFLQPRAR